MIRSGLLTENEIARWEEETDVCVIGQGAAGAAAAIAAAHAGARTLVLERAGGGGGTSALSGGVIYLGGGTALQRACGFADSSEQMFRYIMASAGEAPDEAKIRRYCEGSPAHFEWLLQQGIPFKEKFYHGTSGEPPTDDGLVYSGAERTREFRAVAKPAPRGHVPQMPKNAGPLLMQKLCAAAARGGAQLQGDHRVHALVQNAGGEIVGVAAQHFGARRNIRARRGVVLATGGFVLNDAMLKLHIPRALQCGMRVASAFDDGSGIRLGMAAGAATAHLSQASISLPVNEPWGLKRGVLVNARGRRFINEDNYYGRIGARALFENDGRAWLIVDDAVFEEPTHCKNIAATGETITELARELKLPEGALEETMAFYNRHAAQGADPLFAKHEEYLQPLTRAPFGAIDCTTENSLYAAFTLGGLVTDDGGRVLDPEGSPLPGLFAAGRCAAGVCTGGYSSGLSLGDGTFFGRLAGESAAANK